MKRIVFAALAVLLTTPAAAQFAGSTRNVGAPNLATGQVSVGTTATMVLPARPTRLRANLAVAAANNCAVGGPSVTLTTGYRLQAAVGASLPIDATSPVYVACDATTTVSFFDAY